MTEQTTGIGDRLKQETAQLHAAAEGHDFQRAFGAGRLARSGYVRYLGQMYLVHRGLEGNIQARRDASAVLSAVVMDRHFRERDLESDLRFLGVDPSTVVPVPATARLTQQFDAVAADQPDTLLGYHYVLEGSNNGNAFIARAIRKAYDFSGADGTRYLDPYGDQQRTLWKQYKEALAGLTLSQPEADAIVDAAGEMFQAIGRIGSELLEPVG